MPPPTPPRSSFRESRAPCYARLFRQDRTKCRKAFLRSLRRLAPGYLSSWRNLHRRWRADSACLDKPEITKWTRAAGPLEPVSWLETRPLLVPFYHAAKGFVCCCEHVVNAAA